LDQRIYTRYFESSAELKAEKMLFAHRCHRGTPPAGCSNLSVSEYKKHSAGSYVITYSEKAVSEGDEFFVVLSEKTRNSGVCVGHKTAAGVFSPSKNFSRFCDSVNIPPAVEKQIQSSSIGVNALVIYSRA
jgi:hypothetical protein